MLSRIAKTSMIAYIIKDSKLIKDSKYIKDIKNNVIIEDSTYMKDNKYIKGIKNSKFCKELVYSCMGPHLDQYFHTWGIGLRKDTALSILCYHTTHLPCTSHPVRRCKMYTDTESTPSLVEGIPQRKVKFPQNVQY